MSESREGQHNEQEEAINTKYSFVISVQDAGLDNFSMWLTTNVQLISV